VRGPNPTAIIIIRFEHGRLGQSSLPVCRLEAKSSDAKEDWARGGCAGASFGPPLPLDLCQILSKSRDCALRARAFTSLNQSGFEHGRLRQSSLPNLTQAVIGIARREFSEYNFPMSLHRSLRSGGSTAAKRNVLKRFERVTLLKKRGQWKAGMKSTGLPKTKPE